MLRFQYFTELLTEAQNYEAMFEKTLNTLNIKDQPVSKNIESIIKKSRQSLKKSDRITWFLKLVRWNYLQAFKGFYLWLIGNEESKQERNDERIKELSSYLDKINNLIETYKKDFEGGEPNTSMINGNSMASIGRGSGSFDYFNAWVNDTLGRLSHYLSLEYEPIQNYQFNKQNERSLIQDMIALEDEWRAKQKEDEQLIHVDDESNENLKVVHKFDDDFYWVNLSVPYCRREGDAMGHCGNSAAYKSGDTVLSLRKLIKRGKEEYWRPSLTFILNENGFLGEMKGRANNKPDSKYHPYIVELLKKDFIKGIRGGGYAPENNFKLNDLPQNIMDDLLELKPSLGGFKYRYNNEGMTPDLARDLEEVWEESSGFETGVEVRENDVIIGKTDLDTILRYKNYNNNFSYYVELYNGEEYADMSHWPDDDEAENAYDDVKNDKEWEDLDEEQRDDVKRALVSSYEVKYMNNAFEALKDALEDPSTRYFDYDVGMEVKNGLDGDLIMTMSHKEFVNYVDEVSIEELDPFDNILENVYFNPRDLDWEYDEGLFLEELSNIAEWY